MKRIWLTTINFCIDSNLYLLQCQVCYYLMVGQVKSVKTVLKQLQQSIQTVTSAGWPSDEEMIPANVADNFQWLTKDHLCILVYLVTVMHSMQVSFILSSSIEWLSMPRSNRKFYFLKLIFSRHSLALTLTPLRYIWMRVVSNMSLGNN